MHPVPWSRLLIRQRSRWSLVSTTRVLNLFWAFRHIAKSPVPPTEPVSLGSFQCIYQTACSCHSSSVCEWKLLPEVLQEIISTTLMKSRSVVSTAPYLSMIASHFIRGCSQAGQLGFVLHKSMPTVLDCLLVLYRSLSNRAPSTFFLYLAATFWFPKWLRKKPSEHNHKSNTKKFNNLHFH